jgi:ATP-dependent RNA helicase RhlE
MEFLISQIRKISGSKIIVFTRTKHGANKVAQKLCGAKIEAAAIHGNKSQRARTQAISGFKSGDISVLVATDIASRGIDVDKVTHVFNFEIPNEAETYVHRIGRTARAGQSGEAYSYCSADEREYLRDIEKLIKNEIPIELDHKFHSQEAQDATGSAAKPPPKSNNRGGGRNSRNNSSGRGKSSGGGNRRGSGGGSGNSQGGNSRRRRNRSNNK